MRLLRNISWCWLPAICLVVASQLSVVQANQTSLTVSPAIIEDFLDAGQQGVATVTVINLSEQPLPIQAITAPFVVGDDEHIIDGEGRYDASDWLRIEPASVLLAAGESEEVTITYDVPADAGPGGHYATVYFEPLVAAQAGASQGPLITARVGVLVLLSVRGEGREELALASLSKEVSAQTGEVRFITQVENTGNVHALPGLQVLIEHWWGGEAARLAAVPALVMPGTSRQLKTVWSSPPAFGMYKVTALLNNDGSDQNVQQMSKRMIVIVRFTPLLVTVSAGLTSLLLLVNLVRYVKVTRSN